MFYANFLFTCGLTMAVLGNYGYGTAMFVAGIIIMFIGTVCGLKIEYNDSMKKLKENSEFAELKRLVDAQSEQIQLLQEEIDILKHR